MPSIFTWARSYCACWTSQLSALPPKALDSRTAISGEIPLLPFTSSESVTRETPSAWAASVIVKPNGSMHSSRTKLPGCGGFFIGIVCLGSVVIHIVNLRCVAIRELENDSPVGAHRDRPITFQVAVQRMQP